MEFEHIPVLLNDTLSALNIKPNGIYLDCTMGGGGHSSEIAKRLTSGKLIGLDKDGDAIKHCQEKFKVYGDKVVIVRNDFKNASSVLEQLNIEWLDGVLIDLGVSSWQIDNADRGFSYMSDGELDMRMDDTQTLTAKEVINEYSEEKLRYIISNYGDEIYAREIAKKICFMREIGEIKTTYQLVNIVDSAVPPQYRKRFGHSSKKTFQAIRIEVNQEIEGLQNAIAQLISKLNHGGRIAVIAFHSTEDRIVKTLFKEKATNCICPKDFPICICGHKAEIKLITKKPIEASIEELELNPRSASAKLRVAEKV